VVSNRFQEMIVNQLLLLLKFSVYLILKTYILSLDELNTNRLNMNVAKY